MDALTTERLLLRELTIEDAQDLLDMDSDPMVMRYIAGASGNPPTMESCLSRIARLQQLPVTRPGCRFMAVVLKDTGEFLGLCGLIPLDKTEQIEIAYRYKQSAWGNGYATEAARAVLDYGFQVAQLRVIAGVTVPDNTASRHVLEKIGLVYHGIERYYEMDLSYYRRERNAYT